MVVTTEGRLWAMPIQRNKSWVVTTIVLKPLNVPVVGEGCRIRTATPTKHRS